MASHTDWQAENAALTNTTNGLIQDEGPLVGNTYVCMHKVWNHLEAGLRREWLV